MTKAGHFHLISDGTATNLRMRGGIFAADPFDRVSEAALLQMQDEIVPCELGGWRQLRATSVPRQDDQRSRSRTVERHQESWQRKNDGTSASATSVDLMKLRPFAAAFPMFVIAIGFTWLSVSTLVSGNPSQIVHPIVWSSTASICGFLAAARMFLVSQSLRRLSVSAMIVYGVSRGCAYLLGASLSPIGVWLIVAGLAVKDWHKPERG